MVFIDKLIHNYATAVFKVSKNHNETIKELKDLSSIMSKLQYKYDDKIFIDDRLASNILFYAKSLKLAPLTLNLLAKLLQKKRLKILPKLCNHLEELQNKQNGIEKAKVVSARALNDREKGEVTKYLNLKFNKKFELENLVDESLIGGVKVTFNDFLLDNSIDTKLRKIQSYISNN